MPDWSRRRALHALGATAAAALAGCSSESSEFDESPSRQRGDPVTDYDLRKVRARQPEELFWQGERSTEREDDRPGDHTYRPGGHTYVGSADDLADVTFADSGAAAELASFTRGTDFESSSVILQARTVRECYAVRLRGVWREDDGLDTWFCSNLQPADVDCSADARETVGVGIRLPFPDDGFSSFGLRWSRSCDPRPEPVTADGGGAES